MNMLNQIVTQIKIHHDELNTSNFTGAIDVIAVKQKDGTIKSTPFYVRFGKLAVPKPKGKIVRIYVNNVEIPHLLMKLNEAGEAAFIEPSDSEDKSKTDSVISDKSIISSESSPGILKSENSNELQVSLLKPSKSETSIYPENLNKSTNQLNDNFTAYLKAANALNSILNFNQVEHSNENAVQFYVETEIKINETVTMSQRDNQMLVENCVQRTNSGSSLDSKSVCSCENIIYRENDIQFPGKCSKCSKNTSWSLKSRLESPLNSLKDKLKNRFKCKNSDASICLGSKDLESLNLKNDMNTITYSVSTASGGFKTIQSYIYLWNYNEKIVISDIDGTITKSDVRGQIYQIFGKEWFHENLAALYDEIDKRSYKIIYLSARSMCQSDITRALLNSIKQNDIVMPKGPIILNPVDLLEAFHTEIIDRSPDVFKTQFLTKIKELFQTSGSSNENTYHAGFGNRPTDINTYLNIGIGKSLIFIVNQFGEITTQESDENNLLNYKMLNENIDFFSQNFNQLILRLNNE